MQAINPTQLASYIDHTFLKPDGGSAIIEQLCEEARELGFATVMVNPAEIDRCVSLLKGSQVGIGSVIGFPLGQNTARTKLFEAKGCIESGASELDMVINQRALRRGDAAQLKEEIGGFAQLCRSHRVVSKVILECCNLTDDEKISICQVATEAGCTFVKTSTGFSSGGATVHDVRLLKAHVGPEVAVKASGGIRSLADALAMLNAGATRLGTSSGVALVCEMSGTGSVKQMGRDY